jgi:high-affinity iron transporter
MYAPSFLARAACAGALILVALACEQRRDAAPPPPAPALQADRKPAPPPAAAPAPAEAETAAMPAGDATRGAPLYAANCASCHGEKGNADGPAGLALTPKPAKHSDAAYMKPLSDEHLFKVVKSGGASVGKSPLMAPFGGTLSDQQIADLVAFMRTLAH